MPSFSRQPLVNDAIIVEDEEAKNVLNKSTTGAGFYDTSEFLLGKISVAVIFVESDGTIDTETEDWSSSRESQCVSEIQNGLNWLSNQNTNANISFTYHFHYGRTNSNAQTGYEPISRKYYDDDLWMQDIMANLGYSSASVTYSQHAYLNDLIEQDQSNWGVVIWVVDSDNDSDGMFEPHSAGKDGIWGTIDDVANFAYAAVGGPYIVMTYDNDGWGISNLDAVIAHEIQHSFYAMDEYFSAQVPCDAHRGYLDEENQNSEYGTCSSNVSCIMRSEYLSNTQICAYTRGQIGWYDDDSDQIPNILDTEPITSLNTNPSGTIYKKLIKGSNDLNPLNNENPSGIGNDITTNEAGVELKINSGSWTSYQTQIVNDNNDFALGPFSNGSRTIQVRATNSVGLYDQTPESFTCNFFTHLISETNYPLASNSSRKVWANEYWNPQTDTEPGYRLVYEDNGDIYYTQYYYSEVIPGNPVYSWTDEILISDGSGNNKYPSIDVGSGGDYCIVWQQYVPSTGKYKIIYRVFETSWPDDPVIITDQSTTANSKPVVGASCGKLGMYYGWDYNIVWDNGNGLKYYRVDGSGIQSIPGTNAYSHNPTITSDPNLSLGKVAYAWEQNGDIDFQIIDLNSAPSSYTVAHITSSYSQLSNCKTPSIAKNSDSNIMLVWCATESSTDNIYSREFISNSWQSLVNITEYFYEGENPVVSSTSDDFSVIWKVKNNDYFAIAENVNGQGWSSSENIDNYYVSGVQNPTISASNNTRIAVWSEPASSYYKISPNKTDDLSNGIPQNITSNFTLLGNITLENDLTISNNAIVTIASGTNIKLASGKKIVVQNGSKITAIGTESNPISFRRSGSSAWDRIQLNGGNNEFEWCVFDGGTYNVDIRSRYNDFSHCTFKNAERGVNSYVRSDASWSSFELDNCNIENNLYGVVAWHTYAAINNCTMQNNTSYGLSLLNSRVGNNTSYGSLCGLFTKNLIQNNGTYGINIVKNASLWLGYGSTPGNNKIFNNDNHEIYIQSSTSARLYEANNGGYGAIYDSDITSNYIHNLGKTWEGEQYVLVEVSAENNYWGSSGPSWENFYGPVDYTPYLSSDPTGTPGASGYPARVSPGDSDGEPISSENNIIASVLSVTGTPKSTGGSDDLSVKLQVLEDEIKSDPNNPNNAGKLNEMYNLQTDDDPDDKLGSKDNTMSMLAGYRDALMEMDEKSVTANPDSAAAVKINGETAMVLEIYDSYNLSNYKQTLELSSKYDSYIKNSDSRREFLSLKLLAYESTNQYEQALKVLEELKKEVECDYKYYTAPSYELIEQNLCEQLGKPYLAKTDASTAEFEDEFLSSAPEKFALHNNYPNPFNPVTSIPFSLVKESHVKLDVFNTLGQRVATLSDKSYQAGNHLVQFNAQGFSSGIYFVVVQIKTLDSPSSNYVFNRKMILLK